jgi:hypothetical protein
MKLSKRIKRKIENKLSFTNGWAIDNERYSKLCKELADEIILDVEAEWNRRKNLVNSTKLENKK